MGHADSHANHAMHLRGVVLPDGQTRDLFVHGDRITFEPVADATTVFDGGYLIPGLVDAHAHLELASPAPHHASPVERSRASARQHLAAGVLAVREPGGPNHSSHGLGPAQGLPRIFTAGHFLARPGGYFPGLAREVLDEALPAAAEAEARASGSWAKVIGDFVGDDGRMELNFRPESMAEAARRVHSVGARIAIHATTAESIEAALEADFDSIEHGWGLREDHLRFMVARGTALVPTLTILKLAPELLASLGLDDPEARMMAEAARRLPEMTRRAIDAGVLVLAGTDAGMGPHGRVRDEIGYLLEAGISPDVALGAGSWTARQWLGLPGIVEGAPADLVGYPDDPRGDVRVLARPSLRILNGHLLPTPDRR